MLHLTETHANSHNPDADSCLAARLRRARSLEDACAARNALVERNADLAEAAARRVVPPALASHFDDARQECLCALLEAAASFDPGRGVSFRGYAFRLMVWRAQGYLAVNANAVRGERLGRGLRKLRGHAHTRQIPADQISDAEFSAATRLPLRTVRNFRPWLDTPSLDQPAGPDSPNASRHETVGAAVTTESLIGFKDAVAQLRQRLAALGWQDRYLLTRCYGLDGDEPCSLAQAAAVLGCSRQRAGYRVRRALKRLRAEWRD